MDLELEFLCTITASNHFYVSKCKKLQFSLEQSYVAYLHQTKCNLISTNSSTLDSEFEDLLIFFFLRIKLKFNSRWQLSSVSVMEIWTKWFCASNEPSGTRVPIYLGTLVRPPQAEVCIILNLSRILFIMLQFSFDLFYLGLSLGE